MRVIKHVDHENTYGKYCNYLERLFMEYVIQEGKLDNRVHDISYAMNVRHNNCDPADQGKYNEKFAKLSAKEQEEWYDNIYQEGLMAFLSLEQVKREKKIADFKKK